MSCHPNHDAWKLASPEDERRQFEDDDELAKKDLDKRVADLNDALDVASKDWPGEWHWTYKGEDRCDVRLCTYDSGRFFLCMDGAECSSLEDLHQSLLLFADIVSQHMR